MDAVITALHLCSATECFTYCQVGDMMPVHLVHNKRRLELEIVSRDFELDIAIMRWVADRGLLS